MILTCRQQQLSVLLSNMEISVTCAEARSDFCVCCFKLHDDGFRYAIAMRCGRKLSQILKVALELFPTRLAWKGHPVGVQISPPARDDTGGQFQMFSVWLIGYKCAGNYGLYVKCLLVIN
jgi:hypothetical protein